MGDEGEADGGPKMSLPSLGVGDGGVIGLPVDLTGAAGTDGGTDGTNTGGGGCDVVIATGGGALMTGK